MLDLDLDLEGVSSLRRRRTALLLRCTVQFPKNCWERRTVELGVNVVLCKIKLWELKVTAERAILLKLLKTHSIDISPRLRQVLMSDAVLTIFHANLRSSCCCCCCCPNPSPVGGWGGGGESLGQLGYPVQ